jgi:hypothetical protein
VIDMTVYDHTKSPPRPYTPPCIIGVTGIDVTTGPANYPTGVFPAKSPDVPPDGKVDSGQREIVNGESCAVWVDAPPVVHYFQALTARQLRLWLLGAGVPLVSIDGLIAAIPDATQRAIAAVEWEYATQYERTHPLIAQVGAALMLSPEQIDAAFTEAAKL